MPTYSYVAVNSRGETVRGKVTAANEMALEERLHELKLDVIDYKTLKKKAGGMLGGGVGPKDLIMMCVHLEQLDRAGVPLLEALEDLRDSAETPAFRDLMADVFENVKGGEVFSSALQKHSDVFGEVFIGLVAAGEHTGRLAESFAHLASHLKWSNDLRRAIKKAIRYPIGLMFLMSAVITLMMMFVVPQLSDFLTSQGFELPIHTRALIATSDAFLNYWYVIFGIPVFTIIMLIVLYRVSPRAKYRIDAILLRTPLIGPVFLKIDLARFVHFFSITFSSGIGVLECLRTAQKVISSSVIKESVGFIMQNVSEGNSLTKSLQSTHKFPSLVVRMFKVGEDSGNMDQALENITFFYNREVDDSVEALIGMIQPLLTIVMGLVMFWITAAIFGPLYQSFSNLDI